MMEVEVEEVEVVMEEVEVEVVMGSGLPLL